MTCTRMGNNTLLKKLNFQDYSYFSNIFVRNHQNTTLTIYLLFFQNREKIFLDIHIQIFLPNTEDNIILPWFKGGDNQRLVHGGLGAAGAER